MTSAETLFTSLYEQHIADVERFVRRRTVDSRACDVVAETFLVAWRRLDDVPSTPLPWLYGVARKVLANDRRSQRRGDGLLERLRVDIRDAEDAQDQAVDRVDALRALAELRPADREALILTEWDGLTASEASLVAGCSAAAFRLRQRRARARLRRLLDVNSTPTSPRYYPAAVQKEVSS